MPDVDLTPFGFTPTESLAYNALLQLGPASGYAVAKHLSVARANAYQALNGLVAKGAAQLTSENPQRFQAARPEALVARIAVAEADKLGRLERQVAERGGAGHEAIVPVEGERALLDVVMRAAGRAAGPVRFAAPRRLRDALTPVWRKRDAAGAATEFTDTDGPLVLFWSDAAAVIATHVEPVRGYWCSEPHMLAATAAAIDGLRFHSTS